MRWGRLPWPASIAGLVVIVFGTAAFIRGAVPQSAGSSVGSTGAEPIVVANAFVRPPVPPTPEAAAYFTIFNTTAVPDELESVTTGAGGEAVLHTYVGGVMTAISGGLEIPAHGSVVLSVGHTHVMISDLFGPLKAGQTVNIDLVFANAGPVEVEAPVVPFGAPTPGSPSTASSRTATSSTGASK